jgi:hypothetical protein
MARRVETRTVSRVVSRPAAESDALAWHVHQDLWAWMDERQVELSDLLGIRDELRSWTDTELLELLCDDVAHLLRDGALSRVHLLVHEPEPEAASGAHVVLYRATYEIGSSHRAGGEAFRRGGGLLRPFELAYGGLAILVEWRPAVALERTGPISPPGYHLSWCAAEQPCAGTALVRYGDGSLTADGAAIVRPGESAPPGRVGYLDVF